MILEIHALRFCGMNCKGLRRGNIHLSVPTSGSSRTASKCASPPQQEGLAAEALQAVESTEEADTVLMEDYKGEEVQESGAMDGEAGL